MSTLLDAARAYLNRELYTSMHDGIARIFPFYAQLPFPLIIFFRHEVRGLDGWLRLTGSCSPEWSYRPPCARKHISHAPITRYRARGRSGRCGEERSHRLPTIDQPLLHRRDTRLLLDLFLHFRDLSQISTEIHNLKSGSASGSELKHHAPSILIARRYQPVQMSSSALRSNLVSEFKSTSLPVRV